MIERQLISDHSIIDHINANYDINVTTLTLLALGADVNAYVYKAETHEGLSYFIKLKTDDICNELQLLLNDSGIKQIIAPIKTIHGNLTQRIGNKSLIVYPFIDGYDGFSHELTNDQWITLGKALRQIHELCLPQLVESQIKRETYSSKWRDALRSIYDHTALDQNDEIAKKLLLFMQKHDAIIKRLINRAEQLAQKIQNLSPKFVLCHADIHGGNVLIDKDGTLYIVDWDQPIMAPKERDLMFIGGGVANVWNKHHEIELFYKGYGKTQINKDIISYYRHERIVEDIAIYSQELLLTSNSSENKAEMFKHFIDMFKPQGVVDIAFKTDLDKIGVY